MPTRRRLWQVTKLRQVSWQVVTAYLQSLTSYKLIHNLMPKEKNSVKNVYVSYINVSSHLFFCSFLQQPNATEFTDCLSMWTGDKNVHSWVAPSCRRGHFASIHRSRRDPEWLMSINMMWIIYYNSLSHFTISMCEYEVRIWLGTMSNDLTSLLSIITQPVN